MNDNDNVIAYLFGSAIYSKNDGLLDNSNPVHMRLTLDTELFGFYKENPLYAYNRVRDSLINEIGQHVHHHIFDVKLMSEHETIDL